MHMQGTGERKKKTRMQSISCMLFLSTVGPPRGTSQAHETGRLAGERTYIQQVFMYAYYPRVLLLTTSTATSVRACIFEYYGRP